LRIQHTHPYDLQYSKQSKVLTHRPVLKTPSFPIPISSALTEKIVAALPKLRCPLRLEPHQIQGLDNVSIFPVVQWLVKKALETREEMQAQQRNSKAASTRVLRI